MISAWTKNLKSLDDADRFKKHLFSSKAILERLQELMDEEKNALETVEISPKMYDSPNWDYKQAHNNGFRAALKMVSKLITLDPQEITQYGRQPTE